MFSGEPMDRDVKDAEEMCKLSQDLGDAEQGGSSREAGPVGTRPGKKKRNPAGTTMENSRAVKDCTFRIFAW
jgi:hypothetical protein